jgi:hypothetical protein
MEEILHLAHLLFQAAVVAEEKMVTVDLVVQEVELDVKVLLEELVLQDKEIVVELDTLEHMQAQVVVVDMVQQDKTD